LGITVAEGKHDSSVMSPGKTKVEADPRLELPPKAFQDGEPVPSPVFALPAHKPAWQGRVFLVCGASLCLLAGAGIVYLTNMQSRTSGQPVKSVSTTVPAMPANVNVSMPKVNVSMPPAAAAASGNTTPGPSTPMVRTGSGLYVPARQESSTGAKSPAAAKAGNATVTNVPPPSDKANPGAEVIAAPGANDRPAAAGAAAANISTADVPAQPPERASAPPVVQNEAPPVSTFAQLIPNSTASLEGLAAVRRPAVQTPPASKRATPPTVISRVMPVYPEIARRLRASGTVVVEVQIDEQGRPVKAVAESGPAVLYSEAVNAVLQWRFKPATLDGVAISSVTKVSIVFISQDQNGGQR
jgi:TonB family protein